MAEGLCGKEITADYIKKNHKKHNRQCLDSKSAYEKNKIEMYQMDLII